MDATRGGTMDRRLAEALGAEMEGVLRRAYESGYRAGKADAEARAETLAREAARAAREALAEAKAAARQAVADAKVGLRTERSERAKGKEWGRFRPAIYEAIAEVPGRTLDEVAEAAGAKLNTTRLTLLDFAKEGYVLKDEDGRFTAVDPDRDRSRVARRPAILKDNILRHLGDNPGATTNQVIDALGVKSTSARSTLYALRDEGQVAGSGKGWSLTGQGPGCESSGT